MNTLNTATLINDRVGTIEYYKRELACLRKNQKALTRTTKHVNAVLARHPEIVATAWTSIMCWSDTDPVTLIVSICHKVTSMKEGIAPAFMRSVLEAGFDIGGSQDAATALSASRTFKFKRPSNETMVPVELTFVAQLENAPDATCRKVQTGTKVVEVPTYELVCEE
ncbi:MAG: hypothetical protein JW384_02749 [Nitrosomonadaceae bacterium]|nr:hypothetical protein [Nitrosomonadaceae bacterium]